MGWMTEPRLRLPRPSDASASGRVQQVERTADRISDPIAASLSFMWLLYEHGAGVIVFPPGRKPQRRLESARGCGAVAPQPPARPEARERPTRDPGRD